MDSHVRIVAILYLVMSCLGLLAAFFIYSVLNLAGSLSGDQEANFILAIVANVLTVVLVVSSIPGIIGAIGLLKFKEWARILIIILSFLNLLNFPLGTALGGYSIWVLIHRDTIPLFSHKTTDNQETAKT